MTERHNIITEKHDLMTVSDSLAIVGKTNKDIIDNFFSENYKTLLLKSKEYCKIYKTNVLDFDELISDIYISTLENVIRTKKLTQLILLSAATLNYNYNNKAFYHILKTIYTHAKSNTNINDRKKRLKIVYCSTLYENNENNNNISNDSNDNLITDLINMFNFEDVYKIALQLSYINNNYWKYKLWKDYYIGKQTYTKLSEHYNITRKAIFLIVKDYNKLIKTELLIKLNI
jgi:hypothetical protein